MGDRWTRTWKLRSAALLACVAGGCIEANRSSDVGETTADGDATSVRDSEVGFDIVACEGCAIASTCFADGDSNPSNPCEVCDLSRAADGWSPVLESKTCEDGDACTEIGTCQGSVCVTPPPTGCTDLPECVTCDSNCDRIVAADTCFIDGKCVAKLVGPPGDNCYVCDPAADQTAWTATNARCDDGDPCTYEDTCSDGVCAGQDNTCADAFTCTLDFCDGGQCLHQIVGNACLVNNQCFTTGASLAGDPCRTCQPAVSTTQLTIAPGAACDDQDVCTMVSTCAADGVCGGDVANFDSEPNNVLASAQDVGIADGGFPSGTLKANIVGTDTDVFRWGMTFTNNGLLFSPRARVTFGVATQYELCVYARCGQVAASSFAPAVLCLGSGESASELDGNTRGCCRRTEEGVSTPLSLTATCAGTVVQGFGYARVRALGEVDDASCGGYSFDWGTAD